MNLNIDFFYFCIPCLFSNGIIWNILKLVKIDIIQTLLEHTFQIVPFILISSTVISRDPNFIVVPCCFILLINLSWSLLRIRNSKEDVLNVSSRFRDLSMHRGIIYIITCICIFARDLPKFRYELGKSSQYGTRLMDVGVGIFVAHMGVKGYGEKFKKAIKSDRKKMIYGLFIICSVLFILGVIKNESVRFFKLSYSPMEYGRDFNVFIILSIIKFLGTITEILCYSRIPVWLLGTIIAISYEGLLRWRMYSFTNFDHYDLRLTKSFFEANAEPILSIIGYMALYLFGRQLGIIFFAKLSQVTKLSSVFFMFILSVMVFLFNKTLISYHILYEESRRLCNLSYIMWMISTFLLFATLTRILMRSFQSIYPDQLHYTEKIDKIGFIYFLSGNILVGVFRLLRKMNFIFPNWSSPIILYFYCSVNIILSHVFKKLIKNLLVSMKQIFIGF